jgi:hypothetical protein
MGNTRITFLDTLAYPHWDIQQAPFTNISLNVISLFPVETEINKFLILLYLSSETKFKG